MNDLKGKQVAIVASQYYPDLAELMVGGAVKKFTELGGEIDKLKKFFVPGAFEIPQAAARLVESGKFDAVVCLGLVIQGDTAHFNYVCTNVTRGIGEITRQAEIPVIFGVLTTLNRSQAEERLGGRKGHKGEEAMEAAFHMMQTLKRINDTVA